GESKAQLTGTRPSQSISPFAPPAFTGFHAPTKRSDFCMDVGRSSLPPSGLPLAPHRSRAMGCPSDPCRPPRVRTLDVLPLPAPIPLRSRLDFGRHVPWHAHPIGPACTGLHLRSVLQRASGFFPTRPRGARPDCLATPRPACSCLRLAVASNLLRRGLAPPIQGPCLAHVEFDGKGAAEAHAGAMLRRQTLDRTHPVKNAGIACQVLTSRSMISTQVCLG